MRGSRWRYRNVLVGRLPEKLLWGARRTASASLAPCLRVSASASSGVRPCIRACPCAKQLATRQIVLVRVGLGRRRRDEEVERNDLRALVDKLEEGVLAVCAGFAPDDRPCRRYWPAIRQAGRACRCSPFATAGDRLGNARAAGHTGSPRAWRWPRTLRFQTLSSPISIGMLRSIGASRKCCRFRRRRAEIVKRAGRIAIARGRPMLTRLSNRPPTQSQKPNTGSTGCQTQPPCRVASRRRRNGRRPPLRPPLEQSRRGRSRRWSSSSWW